MLPRVFRWRRLVVLGIGVVAAGLVSATALADEPTQPAPDPTPAPEVTPTPDATATGDSRPADRPTIAPTAGQPNGTRAPGPETSPLPSPSRPEGDLTVSRVAAATFFSPSMKSPRRYNVYLPASYDQSGIAYPVLYLLHGDGGNQDSWLALGLQAQMDRAIAGGLPAMIVVVPDGSGPRGESTDWANRWDGNLAIEGSVTDLVTYVDAHYRTLDDRSARFIGGLSAGGFGALNLALHHPDLFSVSMSFSGFSAADDPAVDDNVFGTDPAYLAQYSPADLIRSDAAHTLYYVLSAGVGDAYYQRAMRTFATQLDAEGLAYEFHLVPGGHDGQAWDAGLAFGLAYLASQAATFSGRAE